MVKMQMQPGFEAAFIAKNRAENGKSANAARR